MKKTALVSVYDKTGLLPFVQELEKLGIEILSTGGTAKFLTEGGVKIRSVDEYTGHPEILSGRVKTLHPKIHGGILARREVSSDMLDLENNQIQNIDLVVVNLYPFAAKIEELETTGSISSDSYGHVSLLEFIDIGGPTMIRAAAKNYAHVLPVCDPADYQTVLDALRAGVDVSLEQRGRMAAKVFKTMAAYDSSIARYLSLGHEAVEHPRRPPTLAPVETIVLEEVQSLRYGENPHQSAGLYRAVQIGGKQIPAPWQVLQGKELSYNNLLDLYAALDLFFELYANRDKQLEGLHPAVIIKHSNPCGAAYAKTPLEAFIRARECDAVSAFGGIIVLSGEVNAELAEELNKGFVEVVAIESCSKEAEEIFAKKKNVRLVRCDFKRMLRERAQSSLSIRNYLGDFLLQTSDSSLLLPAATQCVTELKPDAQMMADLDCAWRLSKHVKSNAIVLVSDLQAIGVGAGQMSRLDSARIAVQRAGIHGHIVKGAVAASDAFLPFPDTLEILAESGIRALVQPGGSLKDQDVIKRANELGIVMLFTGERHFRH